MAGKRELSSERNRRCLLVLFSHPAFCHMAAESELGTTEFACASLKTKSLFLPNTLVPAYVLKSETRVKGEQVVRP